MRRRHLNVSDSRSLTGDDETKKTVEKSRLEKKMYDYPMRLEELLTGKRYDMNLYESSHYKYSATNYCIEMNDMFRNGWCHSTADSLAIILDLSTLRTLKQAPKERRPWAGENNFVNTIHQFFTPVFNVKKGFNIVS